VIAAALTKVIKYLTLLLPIRHSRGLARSSLTLKTGFSADANPRTVKRSAALFAAGIPLFVAGTRFASTPAGLESTNQERDVRGMDVPCGSCLWCPVASRYARLCLSLLGLVLAPAFGGASAHAGYVTSGMAYSGAVIGSADGFVPFNLSGDQAPVVVAGIPPRLEEERQDSLDETAPFLPWDRRSGTQVRAGSSRSSPASPGVRKRLRSPDVAFYTDRSASRNSATRLADYGDTVNLYHPCVKRLFRPPRPAPC
jgi:hypothetical protein